MEFRISEEWCMRLAQLEGDAEIGAGRLSCDPVFDGVTAPVTEGDGDKSSIVFGRLINLLRRQRRISLEQLAADADVAPTELVGIESDMHYRPALRTTHQLADYFHMPRTGFLELAGLTDQKNARLAEGVVRYAAPAESTAELTPEENADLEVFVAVLSRQK
ncbi:MAG: helix-turn-helix transcriptional regulator [Gemmatimonadota bacterium]|nr:helix-turn-helix transcriptional regulator [Gemmatimonadota bacterium]